MAEIGLALGVKEEPSSGKGFGECGALRMLVAGLEKRREADQKMEALGMR